jgi:hypothetical protein
MHIGFFVLSLFLSLGFINLAHSLVPVPQTRPVPLAAAAIAPDDPAEFGSAESERCPGYILDIQWQRRTGTDDDEPETAGLTVRIVLEVRESGMLALSARLSSADSGETFGFGDYRLEFVAGRHVLVLSFPDAVVDVSNGAPDRLTVVLYDEQQRAIDDRQLHVQW